ncbi:MAG: FtsX-like permease family protein, partial [Ignavibacteria bacterium]|nr:FtsX-like permease family protein [Ignavibacteria bacterium]
LMSLGIALISLLFLINNQFQEKFSKNIKGIDMVVGAKGSPLQLILSSIYHIDNPTGNILLDEVQTLASNPLIKKVIPISMGDNYRGYRIVGTNKLYIEHFEASLQNGTLFINDGDVAVGAIAAQQLGLKIGDTFASAHGLDEAGESHNELTYKVVGILNYSNSVLDNLLLTSLSSVWAVHGSHEAHEEETHEENKKQITSALVQFRSPLGLMTLPRTINENTAMQAALPSIEVNRLFELLGVGIGTLRALAIAIMIISGISVFVSLYNSLKERKYELALMLSMGASRLQLFVLLLIEGLFLGTIGYVLGLLFSRLGAVLISNQLNAKFHLPLSQVILQKEELLLLLAAIGISLLAAALPSINIYRINISKTLAEE